MAAQAHSGKNAHEVEVLFKGTTAATQSLLTTLRSAQFNNERALQTVAQSLRTQTDRLTAARKKYLEGGDGFAFADVMDKLEAAVAMSLTLLQRKQTKTALYHVGALTVEMQGYFLVAARDMLHAAGDILMVTLLNQHEECASRIDESSKKFESLLAEALSTENLPTQAAATAQELSLRLLTSARKLPDLSLAIINNPTGDAFSASNVALDTGRAELLALATDWCEFLKKEKFLDTPTEEEQAASELRESLERCMLASDEFARLYESWLQSGIKLETKGKTGASCAVTLKPLLAKMIEAVGDHQLEGLDIAPLLGKLKVVSEKSGIGKAEYDSVVYDVVITLEIELIKAVNALLKTHPRLALVLNPDATIEDWDEGSRTSHQSTTLDPAAADLLAWVREELEDYDGEKVSTFEDVTGRMVCALLQSYGGSNSGLSNPLPAGANMDVARTAATNLNLPLLVLFDVIRASRVPDIFAIRALLATVRACTETSRAGSQSAAGSQRAPTVSNVPTKEFARPTPTAIAPRVVQNGGGSSAVHKEGWLQKKGHKRRNWKKRYFVLSGQTLTYYDTERRATQRGSITLVNSMVAKTNEYPNEYRFVIMSLSSDTTLVLRSEEESVREEWLSAFTEAVGAPGGPDGGDGAQGAGSSSSPAVAASAAPPRGQPPPPDHDDDDGDDDGEEEPPSVVTDDLIRETAIRALQWAKRIVRAPTAEGASRESLFAAGKNLKGVLVELKDLLAVQTQQRSADVYYESNARMYDLCESLFDCTLSLIQTCRDIMDGIADPELAAATSKAKTKAISKFADAISSIVYEQATKKNIRTAAVEAAKAAKVVRDSSDKNELVVAAKEFVPASKRLVSLVRRRCEAMQDEEMVAFLHRQCMKVMEDTQTIVSSSMEAVKMGGRTMGQQAAVDSFTNGVASIISHMEE